MKYPPGYACPDCGSYEAHRDSFYRMLDAKRQGCEYFVTLCRVVLDPEHQSKLEAIFGLKFIRPSELVKELK